MKANDIRVGNVLEFKGGLWKVLKAMHTQPGKGGAYIQVEMKDIKKGTKTSERFRSSEDVSKAFLEQKDYQYLFQIDNKLTLMDLETFEQIEVDVDILVGDKAFLQDNMNVTLEEHQGDYLFLHLPDTVILEVKEAEPYIKGQTVTSSFKPAIMENGIKVMVPQFVEPGEKLVIRTEDSTYVERAK